MPAVTDFRNAWPATGVRCQVRRNHEDFIVEEELPFEPCGEGEHIYLHLRKRGQNSDWVAGQLAKFAGLPRCTASFAGLKDRNAVASQWFSLHLPGKSGPDWDLLQLPGCELLAVTRHQQKLRRGFLRSNSFQIVLRDMQGEIDELQHRIDLIREHGVPNYFGEQRFGHGGANLDRAKKLFSGENKVRKRSQRSIYISAARSHIFNMVLTARIGEGSWNQLLPGEVVQLDRRHSYFLVEPIDDEIMRRWRSGELHPSGPLWGRGELLPSSSAGALESRVVEEFAVLRAGLEKVGLKQERRALRLMVPDISMRQLDSETVQLDFSLPRGAYATSVLKELVDYAVASS